MILTIKIPKVNARKSAEDELAQFILDKLKDNDEVHISYYDLGVHTGSWWYGEFNDTKILHKANIPAIRNVLKTFSSKGYIVNDNICTDIGISTFEISK